MTPLAELLQALPVEAAALAGSWIVQLGGAIAVVLPGGALAWKIVRTEQRARANGAPRNGYGRLEERIAGLDRLVENNHEALCDRITESNDRNDRNFGEVWTAIEKLRGVA